MLRTRARVRLRPGLEGRARAARGHRAALGPGQHASSSRSSASAQGWRCLEVGAGGGSISEWLADRVGAERPRRRGRRLDALPDRDRARQPRGARARHPRRRSSRGRVRPRLRPPRRRAPGLRVRPRDGPLRAARRPAGARGLRLERRSAQRHTASGSRAPCSAFMEKAGFDPYFGRRLITELSAAGIEDVAAEGRVRVIRGGTPETAFFRLSLASLKGALIEAGAITEDEVDGSAGPIRRPRRGHALAGHGRWPGAGGRKPERREV